jgi:ParB/RepB/Spo0J family partition protein
MRVHPAADIFPMVSDDGLQSLAESIKANGLRFPIVVRDVPNGDGELDRELIDGRNRLRACEIAGVEPMFTLFEGDNEAVIAFIADVNLERRDMKKGQKAMALAMLYPERRPGKKSETSSETEKVSSTRLSNARAVLAHSIALAQDVIADRVPLDKALEQVKAEHLRSMGNEARLERLRAEAPDLADLVDDDRMTLDEACAANEARQRERTHRLAEARKAATDLWRHISAQLGIIAYGDEYGMPYLLPDSDREISDNVMRLLHSLRKDIPE